MVFSEELKKKVREMAAFKCCMCEKSGIQVHHILPEEENGPDTIDNAAPLCPSCHDIYGANPIKRKEIRERRDFWYKYVEKTYKLQDASLMHQVNDKIEALLASDKKRDKELEDQKEILTMLTSSLFDATSPNEQKKSHSNSETRMVSPSEDFKSVKWHDRLPRDSFIDE